MRVKRPKTVVTFSTMSDALAVEQAARSEGIPGRIIPTPSTVAAGCGHAWCAEEADRPALEESFARLNLAFEAFRTVMMY